jgi:hypothetical protein
VGHNLLHRLSSCQSQIPYPTSKQFATALARTPCRNTNESFVFFDIFIRKHRDLRPLVHDRGLRHPRRGSQRRDEDLIHPLADTLTHRNPLAWCGGAVSSHNDAGLRYPLIQLHPAAIKQLDLLIAVHSGYPGGWWVGEHALERIGAPGLDTLLPV